MPIKKEEFEQAIETIGDLYEKTKDQIHVLLGPMNGDQLIASLVTMRDIACTLAQRAYPEFNKRPGRNFFISYNGEDALDGKSVIGHLAFTHQGYPPMLYIIEQLIPGHTRRPIIPDSIVITSLMEITDHDDFEEFITGWDMKGELGL